MREQGSSRETCCSFCYLESGDEARELVRSRGVKKGACDAPAT